MDLLFGLLFWGAIAYGIWYWVVRKRKNRGIPIVANISSTVPAPEPLNSDIMRKLEALEKQIENVKTDVNKLDKKVSDMSGWFWPILIGGLVGWFWDDIIAIVKFFFLVG
ncbi:MAG TPA: hypothetical protein VI728_03745 [Syntrophales bacterium]|nr:MAG: hypothetical protein A2Z28_01895 [Chloroflexi bacterium RBG_16_51_9]HLE17381.1 hypothetical protein [Syntrophales bacterium]